MAQATTIKSSKVRILLGEGTSPIIYSAPCGFSSRAISFTKGLEEVSIPDCTNPDAVTWTGRDVSSLSISVSGEGVLASESVDLWEQSWLSIYSVPAKIEIEWLDRLTTWTGNLHIESLEINSAIGARGTLNVSMQSDGEFVREQNSFSFIYSLDFSDPANSQYVPLI